MTCRECAISFGRMVYLADPESAAPHTVTARPQGVSGPLGKPIGLLLPDNLIFVFGSNLAGRHGAGAALHARAHHGAITGQGEGFQGSSYAVPTKDSGLKPLGLSQIKEYVRGFLNFARARPDLVFLTSRIGCGLAGYRDEQIGPMFVGSPPNVKLPQGWG